MKTLQCKHCGKIFDPDSPDYGWVKMLVGAVTGATAGSILPGIGTVLGAMMGLKAAADWQKHLRKCPRCGTCH